MRIWIRLAVVVLLVSVGCARQAEPPVAEEPTAVAPVVDPLPTSRERAGQPLGASRYNLPLPSDALPLLI